MYNNKIKLQTFLPCIKASSGKKLITSHVYFIKNKIVSEIQINLVNASFFSVKIKQSITIITSRKRQTKSDLAIDTTQGRCIILFVYV